MGEADPPIDMDRRIVAALLARVAQGDREALASLYRLTSAKLYGVCLRVLNDRSQADEALQDVFVSVWRGAGTYDPHRGAAMTWLLALTRNAAIDRRRRATSIVAVPLPIASDMRDPAPDPLAQTLSQEERRRLRECLAVLEERDRQFISASFLEGSSYPELAQRAAMPLSTLKSRVRRALLKLRECMA